MRSSKAQGYLDIIDAGVKTMVDFGTNDMMPHFIFSHYESSYQNLTGIILEKMREYGIQSLIFTMMFMDRVELITKEKVAEGKLEKMYYWGQFNSIKESINDDLDSFIINLQNSNVVEDEEVASFCTPKLSKEELKLVEEKNEEHMVTYLLGFNADVVVEEMKKTDSKDKYVHCYCRRKTVHLTLESNRKRKHP